MSLFLRIKNKAYQHRKRCRAISTPTLPVEIENNKIDLSTKSKIREENDVMKI
uniref:Uncharacterized protein n=1 Tax=Anguilla anguilla TaxID=7936 RepID=A0A0E9QDQ2_ANGAN